jgi:hydrogenase maturation protease
MLPSKMPIRLLIIGYGNRLRSDDAVGYLAAERLRSVLTDPGIEVLPVHQLTPELADPISRAARVIFIDAAATGEPGAIEQRPITPVPAAGGFTHYSTPGSLLAASAVLFGGTPQATLYSIPGHSFETGERLTARVEEALETLVADLAVLCR